MQEKQKCKQFITKKDNKFIKIMKIYFLLTLIFVFSISAESSFSQSTSITVNLKSVTIKEALREIEKNSDYLFLVMDNAENELSKLVDVEISDRSINDVLDELLNKSNLIYSIVNRQITISKSSSTDNIDNAKIKDVEKIVQQSRKNITGRVVDAYGESIIGANIIEEGTSNGTITDINGNFSLNVASNASIHISYIGFTSQTINTTGQTNFNITILEDTQSLEEVVVVGYGTQRKENLTGAVSSVNVEEALGSRPIPDVGRGLQGVIPGLSVVIPSGEVGSDPIMKIRGQIGSIAGSSNPLILVDNVEIPSIQMINPNDIESISVLKDAAASSIYGSKAAFGVILITTKKGAKTETTDITYSSNLSWQQPFKKIEIAGIDGLEYTLEAHENMKSGGPAGGFWRVSRESFEKIKECRINMEVLLSIMIRFFMEETGYMMVLINLDTEYMTR